ncbi:hypothetical protein BH10PSE11_BH10PSE11_13430 [soil metagenome]
MTADHIVPHTDEELGGPEVTGRNIVIFSDGTGQRGGVFFDEARTNIYKLFRATRAGPDSPIDPAKQIAFYDPGLGSQPGGQTSISRAYRAIYNFLSQATGLGLTRNIIDCYAAIIRLWQPGDRIYLFGFSRGAYTVRCLGSVICQCGIPTNDRDGKPLKRDDATSFRIASHAVKSIYQHVSSPRDAQFQPQRAALARKFREEYGAGDVVNPNEYPFFIGVFDTVAALSNKNSLSMLLGASAILLLLASWGLGLYSQNFWYWLFWLVVTAVSALIAMYLYTHLKFAFRLPGFRWWETIHLTTFRQKFYDNYLNMNVMYARHAISIDERRTDFARVRWGNREDQFAKKGKIPRFEQIWFAGNHADIGGGYPENESRLSDTALNWMVEATRKLGPESLIVDERVLVMSEDPAGMQHDETRNLAFRLAGKSDRDPVNEATLHPSVAQRFALASVLQYDVTAPYRPEALRNHVGFAQYYSDIPPPHTTCGQRIRSTWKTWLRERKRKAREARRVKMLRTVEQAQEQKAMAAEPEKKFHADQILSCSGLISFSAGTVFMIGTWIYQIVSWLKNGVWTPIPLDLMAHGIRSIGQDWTGLQVVYNWLLALPLSLAVFFVGFAIFWRFGILSAAAYKRRTEREGDIATPAQTQA